MKRSKDGKDWKRFRLMSPKGDFLGWITRLTLDDAIQDAVRVFNGAKVEVDFREQDQG